MVGKSEWCRVLRIVHQGSELNSVHSSSMMLGQAYSNLGFMPPLVSWVSFLVLDTNTKDS